MRLWTLSLLKKGNIHIPALSVYPAIPNAGIPCADSPYFPSPSPNPFFFPLFHNFSPPFSPLFFLSFPSFFQFIHFFPLSFYFFLFSFLFLSFPFIKSFLSSFYILYFLNHPLLFPLSFNFYFFIFNFYFSFIFHFYSSFLHKYTLSFYLFIILLFIHFSFLPPKKSPPLGPYFPSFLAWRVPLGKGRNQPPVLRTGDSPSPPVKERKKLKFLSL